MNYLEEYPAMTLTQAWIVGAMGWTLFWLDILEVFRDYDES